MTNYEKIKAMSVEEMAYKAVYKFDEKYLKGAMSLLDGMCFEKFETVVAHNMILLESEVEEDG